MNDSEKFIFKLISKLRELSSKEDSDRGVFLRSKRLYGISGAILETLRDVTNVGRWLQEADVESEWRYSFPIDGGTVAGVPLKLLKRVGLRKEFVNNLYFKWHVNRMSFEQLADELEHEWFSESA